MNEQDIKDLENVEYFDARIYLTELYEKKVCQDKQWQEKYLVYVVFINFFLREKIVHRKSFYSCYSYQKGERLPQFFYEDEMEHCLQLVKQKHHLG